MIDILRVLDEDPDLADGLDEGRRDAAARELRAEALTLPPGPWSRTAWPPSLVAGFGLLVIDGSLFRERMVEGRLGGELLGTGDLLRPWEPDEGLAAAPAGWVALTVTRLAVLDLEFIRRLGAYPEVAGALMGRAVQRSRTLAINLAIVQQPRVETRVRMLLSLFADRWGIVRPDGVLVPLELTHETLASLVAARRSTVSAALGELARREAVTRTSGGWLVRGSLAV